MADVKPGKLVLLAMAMGLVLAACNWQETAPKKGKRSAVLPVEVAHVERSTLSAKRTITGTLEAVGRVQLFK